MAVQLFASVSFHCEASMKIISFVIRNDNNGVRMTALACGVCPGLPPHKNVWQNFLTMIMAGNYTSASAYMASHLAPGHCLEIDSDNNGVNIAWPGMTSLHFDREDAHQVGIDVGIFGEEPELEWIVLSGIGMGRNWSKWVNVNGETLTLAQHVINFANERLRK